MNFSKLAGIAGLAICLGGAAPDQAKAVVFDIGWTGSGGYSLAGQLIFSDSLLGTGVIDGTQIDNLVFEVFLSGISQGTAALAAFDGTPFNLNFDTDLEQFVIGKQSTTVAGQEWNYEGSTVGFASGNLGQAVTVGGPGNLGFISTANSTLTATRAAVVPLPASVLLLLSGLGLLGLLRRHARSATRMLAA